MHLGLLIQQETPPGLFNKSLSDHVLDMPCKFD